MRAHLKKLWSKAKDDRKRYFYACGARADVRECMPAGCSKSLKCLKDNRERTIKCARKKITAFLTKRYRDRVDHKRVESFIPGYLNYLEKQARIAALPLAEKKVYNVKRYIAHALHRINKK